MQGPPCARAFPVDLAPSEQKRMVPIMSSPAAKYPITGLTPGAKLKKENPKCELAHIFPA